MSYLARPRIGFFSSDAMTNPSTANNENVIHLLDYDNVKVLNPPVTTGGTLPKMSDAAYREWMTTLMTASQPIDADDPPSWQPQIPGYWNYWGDHLTTFGRARVRSVWIDDDPVVDPSSDPLVSADVAFNARIVDVNPADTFTTQFPAAGFSVIGADAHGNRTELLRGVPTTSFTRWLNFNRPMGAGTFQAVIPNDRLTFVDDSAAPDSAGLRALVEGARAGGGILLRWCFYGMIAANPLDLYDRFQKGEPAVNPKIGWVVGSIGVWNGEDPVSVPVGRVLQQPGPPYFADTAPQAPPALRVKTHGDVENVGDAKTKLGALAATTGPPGRVGPALAYVDGDRIALDLNTTFPELAKGKTDKIDYGPVDLVLTYGDGQTAVLGPVKYDSATYEQLGAVWEVAFDPSSEPGRHLDDGWLQLRTGDGAVLLREIEVPQVVTDDPAVYLDLGGNGSASGSAELRVFLKGEPITSSTLLEVELWSDVQVPGEVNSINPLVVTATMVTEQRNDDRTVQVEVPAGGVVQFPIEADAAGCYKLRYIPTGMPVDNENPNWSVEYYSTFRVLPYDDYSDVPDEQVTFDYVYEEVFSYYAILYPVMALIIPWGPENTPRDPERVAQFAALIEQAIDESRLGTALQMPITRELSAGKRALLKRWCALERGRRRAGAYGPGT
jgi:hypothetical protein